MFNNCINIKSLNLISFITNNCNSFESMFDNCYNLTIIIDKKASNSKLRNSFPEYIEISYKN